MPCSLSGACPVGGFEFLDTKCQRRLPPEEEEREVMEKQGMSLAGAPGIVCVACLIFLSVVPGVNQSLQADRTAGRGGSTARPKASGPTDAWEDNGAHSVVSSGLTSREVGQF